MSEGISFRKLICALLVLCLISCLLVLHPINPPKAHAQVLVTAAAICGIVGAAVGITNFIWGRISGHKTKEQLNKIQKQLDQQGKQLDLIQKELEDLQATVDQLAKNLEIDTKEIESYIQNIGAQAGIDSIKTHYNDLQDNAGTDITQMTDNQIQQQQAENDTWCTNVLGAWDIKNAVTKINSAICPDTPQEGVLELWTDQSILKMPPPNSGANDFSMKVESTTTSGKAGGGSSTLPIVAERPSYFDFKGMEGGSTVSGVPAPATTWYFAEGSCRPGFFPCMCISNPGGRQAKVKISYFLGSGSVVNKEIKVPPRSRATEVVTDTLGVADDAAHDFSAKVESSGGVKVVAERAQYFNFQGRWPGGDTANGNTSLDKVSYFAEGSCRPNFQTYFSLLNPGNTGTVANLTYMKGDGKTALQKAGVPAHSRVTVRPADVLGVGDDAAHDFSTKVESTSGAGLVVERPIYFNYKGVWAGGSCSSPTTSITKRAYLADGTCRPTFHSYITLFNPGNTNTEANLTYMKGDGKTALQKAGVPAHSRVTVRPADVLGVGDDAAHDFSTKVESTSGAGLVVESPMYFNYNGVWAGGHCKSAAGSPGSAWYFAEGTLRPGFETYLCVQNPNGVPVDVRLTYMWGNGDVSTDTVTVPASSRRTVAVKDSPASKTLTNYYESLKSYFLTLLYYQTKGADLIAEAYNKKYMDPDSGKPAPQTLNYMNGSFRRLIQQELNEFLSCVESLVTSWSYAYSPNGLVPEAYSIFSDADFLYLTMNNSVLYMGSSDFKNYYGALGRAFARQPDMMYDSATGIAVAGPAAGTGAEQTWRPVRLKYYDSKQQKLIEDGASVGVARYHRNCDPGDYVAILRGGMINTGLAIPPAIISNVPFTVQNQQVGGAKETPPTLPYGDFLVLCQPKSALLGQFGNDAASVKMPAPSSARPPVCNDISAGDFSCAYLEPSTTPGCGAIRGWGSGSAATDFPPGDNYTQISTGGPWPNLQWDFGLAIKNDGSIVPWGSNAWGTLQVPKDKVFVQVAAGGVHGLALKRDGSIVGWGDNYYGQAVPPTGNDFVQVAAGGDHSLALKKDGSIVGWGSNLSGQAVPPSGNDFVQVAAGDIHSVALKRDGSLVAWGDRLYGEINCPPGNDFVRIASGAAAFHSVALRRDSSLAAWGRNDTGQTVAPTSKGNMAISAGRYTSLFTFLEQGQLQPWTWR